MKTNQTSLVIDGNYLMFQSFYATYRGDLESILRSSKGVPTNAITIFFSQFIKLVYEYQPDYVFIAFDAKEKTARHLEYSEYKSGRSKAPNEIFIQFDIVKELLTKLGVAWTEKAGFEADDLIASYCKNFPGEKYVFSRDKDLLQLVNEDITVVHSTPKIGYVEITNDNFYEMFKYHPHQVVSFKGLKGDPSDNLPGIKGIGDVTAIKLLQEFGDFENIYKNINSDKITASVRKKLIEGEKEGLMCYKLAQLIYDIPNFPENENNYLLAINIENAEDMLIELDMRKTKNYLRALQKQFFREY